MSRLLVWPALSLLALSGCNGTAGTLVSLPTSLPSTSVSDAGSAAEAGAVLRPAPGTPWQIQLSGTLDTTADVPWYEVDAFDTDVSAIAALHAQGRTVSCYVSAGTDEPWRADSAEFSPSAVGNALADYSQERWLDVRDPSVRSVNAARLVLAAQRGCDAVELSNVQAHTADSGFPLTATDDLDYAQYLLGIAHEQGLSAGVSTSDDLVPELASAMDWGLTEECLSYQACDVWSPLVTAGKAVFMIEYGSQADAAVLCPEAAALGFSLVIKRSSLDAFRVGCSDATTDAGP